MTDSRTLTGEKEKIKFHNYVSCGLCLLFLTLLFSTMLFSTIAVAENTDIQFKNFDITEGRVAFTYMQGEKKDIYTVDFKDLSISPVVTGKGASEAPSWSPDGRKIVFHSDVTGDKEIYSINDDGSEFTQLTNSKGADENPYFSPDGKRIVFQSSRETEGANLYVMNADGSKPTPLLPTTQLAGKKNVTPRFSPRNDEVLFATDTSWPGWDIMIFNLETKDLKMMTQGLGSYIRPAWKPDGAAFAFSYGIGQDIDIWYVEKGRPTPVALIRREGRDLDPCWMDDGQNLLFVSESAAGQNDFQLFHFNVAPQKGQKPEDHSVQVIKSKGAIRHPSWTPLPSLAALTAEIRAKQKANNSQKTP